MSNSRSCRASRSAILITSIVVAGCGGFGGNRVADEASPSPPSCTAPTSGDPLELSASQVDSLAGTYELTVIATRGGGPEATVKGTLELWRADSAYSRGLLRPTDERRFPLVGASDVDLRRLAPVTLAHPPSSRDRERPGVEVQQDGSMWFGNAFSGTGGTNDAGVAFRRISLTPWGFRGEWIEGGLVVVNGAVPGGYFCAVRARK
jgi:hypothetical protein